MTQLEAALTALTFWHDKMDALKPRPRFFRHTFAQGHLWFIAADEDLRIVGYIAIPEPPKNGMLRTPGGDFTPPKTPAQFIEEVLSVTGLDAAEAMDVTRKYFIPGLRFPVLAKIDREFREGLSPLDTMRN